MSKFKKIILPYNKEFEKYYRKAGEKFYSWRRKTPHLIEPSWACGKDEGDVWVFYNERK